MGLMRCRVGCSRISISISINNNEGVQTLDIRLRLDLRLVKGALSLWIIS